MLVALLAGFALGFLGSMPIAGPITVLVFAQGLRGQYRSALAVAGGAAVAESGYAFLAYWGTGEFVSRLPVAVLVSKGATTFILLGLGIYFLAARLAPDPGESSAPRVGSRFGLGLAITALNPTFLATWTAATTVLHATGFVPASAAAAGAFAIGTGAGICSWSWLLLLLMRRHSKALHPAVVAWTLRAIGMLLLGMGAWWAAGLIRAM